MEKLNNNLIINNNSVKSVKSTRIGYIDSLKGFAILLVVLGHIADGYFLANMYPQSNELLYSIYNVIYAFHMPLFMIISGYVYCYAYFDKNMKPIKERIFKQILNLIVIYFIFSVPFGIFKMICEQFTNKSVSITDILMIPIKPISPYWYIYILIPLYYIFSRECIYKLNQWITFGIFVVICICSNFIKIPYFEINKIMYYAVFFYIGIAYKINKRFILNNGFIVFSLFVVSIILCFIFWNHNQDMTRCINRYAVINLIAASGISFMIWYVFEHIKIIGNNSILRFLGTYCLEIYVLHCVFTAGNRIILSKIGDTILSILINMLISLAIPILFSIVCKKLNIHGLFFKPVTYITKKSKTGIVS